MTNLAFPPLPASFATDQQPGDQITLLAGQISAANHRLLTLKAIAPDVDTGTAVTGWQGEGCDYGMAVDALLERDRGRAFGGISGPS